MGFAVLLQYALPHRLASRIVYWVTRWTWRPWKNLLIGAVVKKYQVDMTQAQQPDAFAYSDFNAFFTRALVPGARRAPATANAIACPADGRISQIGAIRDGRIFQAKGQDFSVTELLGDATAAAAYANGCFLTVYLSPRDYHRVHAPLDGNLRETAHIPGRLFSVAPFAVAAVPRLFARNERLVCHFDNGGNDGTGHPFAVIFVGAMLVSGIETVWNGVEVPPYASKITRRDWRNQNVHIARCAEIGRFNMGSTVIVLLPAGAAELDHELGPETGVQMGQPIGHLT